MASSACRLGLLGLLSTVDALSVPSASWTHEQAIVRTRGWIKDAVIRYGLCPYAAAPFYDGSIRYAVYDCEDDEGLIEFFFDEALRLLREPSEKLATTMLITPRYTGDINEFYELYEWLTDTLEGPEEEVLNNQVQPAFFHPDWTFDGLPADSPIHFEKRAPCPVINLLRREDLDQVVAEGLRNGVIVNKKIADHNAQTLTTEGSRTLRDVFAALAVIEPSEADREGMRDK